MPTYQANGDAIRAVRAALGLSQSEAAKRSRGGFVEKTLRSMENSDDYFRESTFHAVGQVLGMAFGAMVRPEARLEPFRGLAAYDGAERALFGGRDGLIADGVALLRERGVLLVAGLSGAGKSSLCRAGIIPEFLKRMDDTVVVDMSPGTGALDALADALVAPFDLDTGALEDLRTLLHRTEGGLADFLLVTLSRSAATGVLIHIDQAEELATRAPDGTALLALLDTALIRLGRRVHVLLSSRSEPQGRLGMLHGGFGARIAMSLNMPRMEDTALREALERPLRVTRTRCDPALIERIVHDARNADGYLPHAQFVLQSLWQDETVAPTARLTLDRYVDAGGMSEAIARKASEVFRAFDAGEREVARAVLPRLVSSRSGSARDVAARTPLSDFGPAAQAVLEKLAAREARILTIDERGMVGFAHEEVIRCWNDLQSWIAEREADDALCDSLERRIAEWKSHGEKNDDLIPPGQRLGEFKALARRMPADALPVDAGRYLSAWAHIRRRFDRRAIVIGATALTVALALLLAAPAMKRMHEERARDAALAALGELRAAKDPLYLTNPAFLFPNGPEGAPAVSLDIREYVARYYDDGAERPAVQRLFDTCPDPELLDLSHLYLKRMSLGDYFATCAVSSISRADFSFSFLALVRFPPGGRLHNARFTGAFLSRADFAEVDLTDADFSCAVLDGANFTGAVGMVPEQTGTALCVSDELPLPTGIDTMPEGCRWRVLADGGADERTVAAARREAFEKHRQCIGPANSIRLADRAFANLKTGDLDTARQSLSMAAEMAPSARLSLRRAHLFALEGRRAAALDLYDRVLREAPPEERIDELARLELVDLTLADPDNALLKRISEWLGTRQKR